MTPYQLFEDGVVDELEDEVQLPFPAENFDLRRRRKAAFFSVNDTCRNKLELLLSEIF